MFIVCSKLQRIVNKNSLSYKPQGRWFPMKLKFLIIINLVFISTFANAGIITNTNNDSFIDETTGIEWMDFGINNHYTFNEVSSLLGKGNEYDGWRLATEKEALDLWYNAFQDHLSYFHHNYRRDGLYNDFYIHGGRLNGTYTYDEDPKPYFSPWDEEFDAMGFNTLTGEGTVNQRKVAQGLFINDIGNTSTLRYINITHDNDYDLVSAWGAFHKNTELKDSVDIAISTMLIKVPEPSTLVIFSLGLMALASRRMKKS